MKYRGCVASVYAGMMVLFVLGFAGNRGLLVLAVAKLS